VINLNELGTYINIENYQLPSVESKDERFRSGTSTPEIIRDPFSPLKRY
jgi:hypothetical protein